MGRRAKSPRSKAEASRSPARKSPKNAGSTLGAVEKRLVEALQLKTEALRREAAALEQQAATAEILQIISRSQNDVQPVFDAIAKRALHLCDSSNSVVGRYDGELLHLAAHAQQTSEAAEALRRTFPMRPNRATASGRALLHGCVVHIPNVQADSEYAQPLAEVIRARATLAVPMLRDGQPIGTIAVGRLESRPFNDKHIALLQTFADQAVIAIENVRLFTELQTSNRDLTTALDKQTATSDILAVISRSQTDAQPVFDAILASAVRLLGAHHGALTRVVGDQIVLAASTLPGSEEPALRAAAVEGSHAQVVRERAPVNIADMQTDPRVSEGRRALARAHGYRSLVAVPLLRQDEALGAIAVTRPDPGGFAADEIVLLRTLADQAVIAIENVRLFRELEARNRDLSETLARQTATSEILNVISRSPTDVQPVFDTVVEHASRLCSARDAQIFRREDAVLRLVAHHGPIPTGGVGEFTMPIIRGTVNGRAVMEQRPIVVADLRAESAEFPEGSAIARDLGHRSVLSVPLMREGVAIGTLSVRRAEVVAFTDAQMALLQTFADQAVIAIENVRLLTELQE